jgi:hypothetical protein
MKRAWDAYVKDAWGANELAPISRKGHTSLFGVYVDESEDRCMINSLLFAMDQFNFFCFRRFLESDSVSVSVSVSLSLSLCLCLSVSVSVRLSLRL